MARLVVMIIVWAVSANDLRGGIITTFTDRASFDAAIASNPSFAPRFEGWDAFSVGTLFPNGTTVGGITYSTTSAQTPEVVAGVLSTSTPHVLAPTVPGGVGFIPGDVTTFSFETPILAFGIDFSTADTTPGVFSVTTNLGDVAISGFDPFPEFGQFAGWISDMPVDSVSITTTPAAGNFAYALDSMRFSPVPEPSALVLTVIAASILSLQGLRSRKRLGVAYCERSNDGQ